METQTIVWTVVASFFIMVLISQLYGAARNYALHHHTPGQFHHHEHPAYQRIVEFGHESDGFYIPGDPMRDNDSQL